MVGRAPSPPRAPPARAAQAEPGWRGSRRSIAAEALRRAGGAGAGGGLHRLSRGVAGGGGCRVAPGRFLMPGDLEGSPALTFSPLAEAGAAAVGVAVAGVRAARFEAYKRVVVEPFFRNHFARLDRQVVLMDVLGALADGPRAVEDLRAAMAEILACFRPGPRSWLAPILGRRIDRILFAATKADYLHHSQHAQSRGDRRGAGAGRAGAGAVLRGGDLGAVDRQPARHGRADGDPRRARDRRGARAAAKAAARWRSIPANLPDDPAAILAPARQGAGAWIDAAYPRDAVRAAGAARDGARGCRISGSTARRSSCSGTGCDERASRAGRKAEGVT